MCQSEIQSMCGSTGVDCEALSLCSKEPKIWLGNGKNTLKSVRQKAKEKGTHAYSSYSWRSNIFIEEKDSLVETVSVWWWIENCTGRWEVHFSSPHSSPYNWKQSWIYETFLLHLPFQTQHWEMNQKMNIGMDRNSPCLYSASISELNHSGSIVRIYRIYVLCYVSHILLFAK
jgi:hypothetical protein